MSSREGDEADPKRPAGPARRKRPRKISAKYLENAAVFYLQRYSSTVAGLRKALIRKIDRSVRTHGGSRADHLSAVEGVLSKLQETGLLDDQLYAMHKADVLRSAGRSTKVIALKLRQKGVPASVAAAHLARVKAEVPDLDAAAVFARKKRLGPYRRAADAESRKLNRQKDLAAMARGGFSYDIAKRIIDGPSSRESS